MQAVGLAEAVERYLAGLVVPQGRYAGEPFPVLPWQSRFVAGAFRDGVLDAALSLGRGNGKTTLCAGLLAATVDLDGPLNSTNAESLLVASSFGQGDYSLPSRPADAGAHLGALPKALEGKGFSEHGDDQQPHHWRDAAVRGERPSETSRRGAHPDTWG